MTGLAGRRVHIALAVVPASIVSVLLIVGGIAAWSGWSQMARTATASGLDMCIFFGSLAVFPVWEAALTVATPGYYYYYYYRRGPWGMCGRGASGQAEEPSSSRCTSAW